MDTKEKVKFIKEFSEMSQGKIFLEGQLTALQQLRDELNGLIEEGEKKGESIRKWLESAKIAMTDVSLTNIGFDEFQKNIAEIKAEEEGKE